MHSNVGVTVRTVVQVSVTILVSATMLYITCAPNPACAKEHGLTNLPAALFQATMMLTGQATFANHHELDARMQRQPENA